jgi:hypothetical protein
MIGFNGGLIGGLANYISLAIQCLLQFLQANGITWRLHVAELH